MVMLSWEESPVSQAGKVDLFCVVQFCEKVEDVAAAPGSAPAVEAWEKVRVLPAAKIREEMVMLRLAMKSVPVLAVVWAGFEPVVVGAVQPLGAMSVTEPLEIPPVGGV